MKARSAHFCRGRIPLGFVFSAPGDEERIARKPVAGETGANLSRALAYLHLKRRSMFPTTERYAYRITNAFPEPLTVRRDGRSEAPVARIREDRNVWRVRRELAGCKVVVLCGQKAHLLSQVVAKRGRTIVRVCHAGNKGLNGRYRLPFHVGTTSVGRRNQRVVLWAKEILAQLPRAGSRIERETTSKCAT